MDNSLKLFILDDDIPKIPTYVDASIYSRRISAGELAHLVAVADWKGQHNLKQLVEDILNSEHVKAGHLDISGFTHPAICLDEIDNGNVPDVVIFDWEYGTQVKETPSWLLELLANSTAFIFVYSAVRNSIPPFLNKSDFDQFASRFQLFLKGDTENSIFSSEEFILQYLLSRLSITNTIKIGGRQVSFTENGYLKNPSDILYLERLFGRQIVSEQFEKLNFTISDRSIEAMLESVGEDLLLDENRKFLISADSTLLIEKFKPGTKISMTEALKKYGILKVREALEIGLAKV